MSMKKASHSDTNLSHVLLLPLLDNRQRFMHIWQGLLVHGWGVLRHIAIRETCNTNMDVQHGGSVIPLEKGPVQINTSSEQIDLTI